MILLTTALDCEARPLLDHYRLRRLREHSGFPVYRNDTDVALIVTGTGRLAAAAGVGYLAAALRSEFPAVWLNVGVAGHGEHAIGSAFLAHKIVCQSSGATGFPPIVIDAALRTDTVITVDRPELDYPSAALYDMEASAFFTSATRFSSAEWVNVLKIVSDNPRHPPVRDPKRVSALIAARLDAIDRVLDASSVLIGAQRGLDRRIDDLLAICCKKFHTSETQLQLLSDRLRRWLVICADRSGEADASGIARAAIDPARFSSARELIAWLDKQLILKP